MFPKPMSDKIYVSFRLELILLYLDTDMLDYILNNTLFRTCITLITNAKIVIAHRLSNEMR